MNAGYRVHKLIRTCKRRVYTEAVKLQDGSRWIKPIGYDTKISVYNPVTKCKVPLVSKTENVLRWYMCGPTVYDSAHIGHATTYVKSDIIRRILSDCFDMNVLLVMGITDIDDKIIKRALDNGQDYRELSRHFEAEFFTDMDKLNVRRPYLRCRITDYMPQIIDFIDKLVTTGSYGYVAKDGSVYFNTKGYDKYGKLATPCFDATHNNDHANKRSPLDFALWKAAKTGEPSWKSQWGHGRPGWHIECSTIASAVFGNSLDMHSGGIDLAFPHHENEEAQSCCYHNVEQWVNYWLHCGHLSLKGDVKMSKSLKNTVSIRDLLEKYSADHFRILCLLSHYRHAIDFSDEVMQNAVSITKKFKNFIHDSNNYVTGRLKTDQVDESHLFKALRDTQDTVSSALADDFDTPKAMHAIMNLVGTGNKMLRQTNIPPSHNNCISAVAAVSNYVMNILSKFGISQSTTATTTTTTTTTTMTTTTTSDRRIEDIIDNFLDFRNFIRKRALEARPKDIALLEECDNIRKSLATCGIAIKDQKNVSSWSWK